MRAARVMSSPTVTVRSAEGARRARRVCACARVRARARARARAGTARRAL
jgi:hypothetical protein